MKYDCTKTLDYVHELRRMCMACDKGKCAECSLNEMECYRTQAVTSEYIDVVQKWSDEHPEPPKLTERDYSFLDCFSPMNKYIKRQYGVLYMVWNDPTITMDPMEIPVDVTMFKCVEKGQKWSFDDLRKLEVEE